MFTREKLVRLLEEGASLSRIFRESAMDVFNEALVIEARRFIDERQELLDDGTMRFTLNGTHKERNVQFPFGSVPVRAPRVLDKGRGVEPVKFTSRMLPRYLRKSFDMTELIPWMYLKGVSESDFQSVFEGVTGRPTQGLSSSTISRLLDSWSDEYLAWNARDMSGERYAYVWADGVFLKARGERENVCQLAALGVDEWGHKKLVGMIEGYAESADNWRELFVKLRGQGMEAPKLVIADGGVGLWSGLSKVYPDCRRQCCWVHKIRDLRRYLPKGRHTDVTQKARDIYMSETRDEASRKLRLLAGVLAVKHRQASETLTKWSDELLEFYGFPAEHWLHLRSTNPIESLYSTVRLRTRKTRGKLNKERLGGLLLKLSQAATSNMNALGHADKIVSVLEGAVFKDGELENVE
jgi:transposase-like protein